MAHFADEIWPTSHGLAAEWPITDFLAVRSSSSWQSIGNGGRRRVFIALGGGPRLACGPAGASVDRKTSFMFLPAFGQGAAEAIGRIAAFEDVRAIGDAVEHRLAQPRIG